MNLIVQVHLIKEDIMALISDYLTEKGDIPFSQLPFNEVDNYVIAKVGSPNFTDVLPPGERLPLGEVLTDYFAASEDAEAACFAELERLKAEQGVADGVSCHYDTPLTTDHEISILKEAGFPRVTLLKQWGATGTILAETASS